MHEGSQLVCIVSSHLFHSVFFELSVPLLCVFLNTDCVPCVVTVLYTHCVHIYIYIYILKRRELLLRGSSSYLKILKIDNRRYLYTFQKMMKLKLWIECSMALNLKTVGVSYNSYSNMLHYLNKLSYLACKLSKD